MAIWQPAPGQQVILCSLHAKAFLLVAAVLVAWYIIPMAPEAGRVVSSVWISLQDFYGQTAHHHHHRFALHS